MFSKASAKCLTNQVEFMGIPLLFRKGTFIPKKQTEFLVKRVIEVVSENFGIDKALKIIDMCAGIGNIAIALAINLPQATIYGVDFSEKAIETAKYNVEAHHVSFRVKFVKGHLFQPLEQLKGQTDLIVCNPPYIPAGKIKYLDKSITDNEPLEALDGGPFGLSFFIKIIPSSIAFLKPGGFLAFEVGEKQGESVAW